MPDLGFETPALGYVLGSIVVIENMTRGITDNPGIYADPDPRAVPATHLRFEAFHHTPRFKQLFSFFPVPGIDIQLLRYVNDRIDHLLL
jgi:hypothetical protein